MVELEHFYHAKLIDAGRPVADIQLAAYSPLISPSEWARYRQLTRIEPYGDERSVSGEASIAIGLFDAGDSGCIFVQAERTQIKDRGVFLPSFHYMILHPDAMNQWNGNLLDLATALVSNEPPPTFPERMPIPRLSVETRPPSMHGQQTLVQQVQSISQNSAPMLIQALIDHPTLYVVGAPMDWQTRLRFVQGLMALLPAGQILTFVTHYDPTTEPAVRICFTESAGAQQPVFTWGQPFHYQIARNSYPAWVYEQLAANQIEGIIKIQQTVSVATRPIFAKMERKPAYDMAAALTRIRQNTEKHEPPDVDDLWLIVESSPLTGQMRQSFLQMLDRVLDKRQPENMLRWLFATEQLDQIGKMLSTRPQVAEMVFRKIANQPQMVLDVMAAFYAAKPLPPVNDEVHNAAFDNVSPEAQMLLLQSFLPHFNSLSLPIQSRLIRALVDQKRLDVIKRMMPGMRVHRANETLGEISEAAQTLAICLQAAPDVRQDAQTVWLTKLRRYPADEIAAVITQIQTRMELALETQTFQSAYFLNAWLGTYPDDFLTALEQISDPGVFLSLLSDYLIALPKPLTTLTDQLDKVARHWTHDQSNTVATCCQELADLITTDFYIKDPLDKTFTPTPAQTIHWLSTAVQPVIPSSVESLPSPETFYQDSWPDDLPVVVDILKGIKSSLEGLRISKLDTRMTGIELVNRLKDAQIAERIGLVLDYIHRLGETLTLINANATRKPGEVKQLNEGKLDNKFANRAELVDVLRWTAGKLRHFK